MTARFTSQDEAEAYLLSFINYEAQTDYRPTTRTHDLERFRNRLETLGWRHDGVPTVHVGGTNGKGSVSWLVERMLSAAGLKTGLYASPHLTDIRERVRISGRPIGKAVFCEGVSRLAEVFAAEAGAGFRTTFEHMTALALLAFQSAKVDRAVIEVGLGGRLDATNVIAPGPAVLTPIAMDHQSILGDTLGEIAADKANILKPGGSAFLMPQEPESLAAIESRLDGLKLIGTHTSETVQTTPVAWTPEGSVFAVEGLTDYGKIATGLLGAHQTGNVSAAVCVVESILPRALVKRAVQRGLKQVRIPGRLDPRIIGGQRYLIDGGHNPHAAQAVANAIRVHYPGKRVVMVLGMPADKDWVGFLAPLEGVVERFVFTRAAYPRAADPKALLEASSRGGEATASVSEGLGRAQALAPDLILVGGSFLVAGEVLEQLSL